MFAVSYQLGLVLAPEMHQRLKLHAVDEHRVVKHHARQPRHEYVRGRVVDHLAVGETVVLLHPPSPLAGVSIGMERGCR